MRSWWLFLNRTCMVLRIVTKCYRVVISYDESEEDTKMEKTKEKRYLNWFNMIGYGSGDMAANFVYSVIMNFVLIVMTDSVGLSAGIVATLIAVSKVFDGVSDVFFGHLLDKTHTKMGKARPWMFWSSFGNAICMIALFAIPGGLGDAAKYAWFFIFYTALNALFYTANNISYSALTALITKNENERVMMETIRFMFSFATGMVVSWAGTRMAAAMGWTVTAIIFAIASVVVNTISVFSVKELPEEELNDVTVDGPKNDADIDFLTSFKLLLKNKYYFGIMATYLFIYASDGFAAVGIYYMKYILGDENLYGTFSIAMNLPMIIGLLFVPIVIQKTGVYKANIWGYAGAAVFRGLFGVFGLMGNIPLMLICMAISQIFSCPVAGDLNAVIADVSEYTFLTSGKRIDGTIFSCSSVGIKIGSAIGTVVAGWMLEAGGYVANAVTQTPECISMLKIMYLLVPFILNTLLAVVMVTLNVSKANDKLRAQKA